MSAKATYWAWEQQVDNPSTKLVLLKLADNANDKGVCWPSFGYLSHHTGFNRRTIMRHIQTLESAGLLTITQRKDKENIAKNLPNLYQLNLAKGSDRLSLPKPEKSSDKLSPAVVTDCHQGSDKFDTRVVTNCHPNLKEESNNKRERILSPIPSDFQPAETTIFELKRNGLKPLDKTELELFVLHYQGEGAIKSNWDAVYKKWTVNQRRNYDKQSWGKKSSPTTAIPVPKISNFEHLTRETTEQEREESAKRLKEFQEAVKNRESKKK